jgi:hypothetical protein
MVDTVIGWLQAHPLEGVGALVVFAVVISLVLVPRVHEVARHGHPRC